MSCSKMDIDKSPKHQTKSKTATKKMELKAKRNTKRINGTYRTQDATQNWVIAKDLGLG